MTTTKLGIVLFLAAAGCASRAEAPADDPPTGQDMLQTAPACDLQRSKVAFIPPGCAACMQDKCCVPTVACFSGNPDCTALHACLVACPEDRAILISVGSDAPETDAKTRREEENPCAAACEEAHAQSVALRSTYDTCIRSQCMPVCGG